MDHLRKLERNKLKRANKKNRLNIEEKKKGFEDYNWEAMYREGKLAKLIVVVLDMYIAKRMLKPTKGALKQEKVDIVTADILRSLYSNNCDESGDDDIDEYDDSDDDEDIVEQEIGSQDDDDGEDESEDGEHHQDLVNCEDTDSEQESISNFLQTTRSFPISCRPQDQGEFVELRWKSKSFRLCIRLV